MTQAPAARKIPALVRAEYPKQQVREMLRSGWIPAGLVLALTIAVLHRYDVPFRETAVFGMFSVLGGTMPGTLLWRGFRGGSRFFAEDVAAGTVLGHAITVLAYIPARGVGLPLLVLAWPVATITAFLMVPALRPCWRATGYLGRVPVWCAWGIATLIGFIVVSSGPPFFRNHGLSWPGYAAPYVDMPFHLGLIGELKHHIPPMSPSALGESLYYHWFVYADMAAISWVTGIEPQTLLYRLFMLPILATSLLLIAAIARRLTRRWWPGFVALGLTYLVLGPTPCAWAPSLGTNILPRDGIWWFSPTQGFGAMLFAPVVLLLVDFLRQSRSGAGPWVLFVTLLAAVLGAKATFLPMLLTGLLVVVAGTLLVNRRLHRTALAAALVVVTLLLFAQFVVFGGTSGGMVIHPLSIFGVVAEEVASTTDPPVMVKGVVVLVSVFGWACVWGGVFGLACRPRTLLDPPILLLVGIGAAGMAVATVLRFPGNSQLFFLWGATPYISLAAACGLVALLPERLTQRSRYALLSAVGGGIALLVTIRELDGSARPTADELAFHILGPFVLLVVVTGALGVALAMAGRRHPALRPLWPAMILAFVTGLVLPSSLGNVNELWQGRRQRVHVIAITRGTLEAGRWLRDHSHPNDVVATNSVCTTPPFNGCDDWPFSVSAYTERRVLVENWIFLAKTHDESAKRNIPDASVPFWDRRRLADNYAAFHHPSPDTVGRLRARYGVRWLFADQSHDRPAPELGRFARLRHTAGDCAVYEITI